MEMEERREQRRREGERTLYKYCHVSDREFLCAHRVFIQCIFPGVSLNKVYKLIISGEKCSLFSGKVKFASFLVCWHCSPSSKAFLPLRREEDKEKGELSY